MGYDHQSRTSLNGLLCGGKVGDLDVLCGVMAPSADSACVQPPLDQLKVGCHQQQRAVKIGSEVAAAATVLERPVRADKQAQGEKW